MICSLSFSSFFFLGFYFRLFSIYAPSCVVFSCILVLVFFFFVLCLLMKLLLVQKSLLFNNHVGLILPFNIRQVTIFLSSKF